MDADIEGRLGSEAPIVAAGIAAVRRSGEFAIGLFSKVQEYYPLIDPPKNLTSNQADRYKAMTRNLARAFRDEIAHNRPLKLKHVRDVVNLEPILGEIFIGLNMQPEEISTIVEFYRRNPVAFVEKIFEKDAGGNYLHPKTVAKVRLCQEYGLLPSSL